jgi:hypothetical protein
MPHPTYEFDSEKLKAMRDAGMSVQEIASHLHAPYHRVWVALQRIGVATTNKPQPGFCKNGHDLSVEGTKLVNKGPGRPPCWVCVLCDRERRKRRTEAKKAQDPNAFACPKNHSKAKWGGPTGCRLCAQQRAFAMHRSRKSSQPPPPRPALPMYSWEDYVQAVDDDFAKPHWMRRAPAIREYLIKNNVKVDR